MIEINLLPEDLKVKIKDKAKKEAVSAQPQQILYIAGAVLGLFLCINFYLAIVSIGKSGKFRSLSNKWKSLEPQRKQLEDSTNKFAALSEDAKQIQQLVGKRVGWAIKLNKLSLDLPSGIWFSEISVTPRDFTLRGSAISLQREEMTVIKRLIDNLKNDADFFKDFNGLELNSVQKRVIGSYDIADFVLAGTIKSK